MLLPHEQPRCHASVGDCAFNNVCGADNTCVLVPDFDYGNSLILCNSTGKVLELCKPYYNKQIDSAGH